MTVRRIRTALAAILVERGQLAGRQRRGDEPGAMGQQHAEAGERPQQPVQGRWMRLGCRGQGVAAAWTRLEQVGKAKGRGHMDGLGHLVPIDQPPQCHGRLFRDLVHRSSSPPLTPLTSL